VGGLSRRWYKAHWGTAQQTHTTGTEHRFTAVPYVEMAPRQRRLDTITDSPERLDFTNDARARLVQRIHSTHTRDDVMSTLDEFRAGPHAKAVASAGVITASLS
jgi:hypothetical protein